jgi:hypothetical protein
MIRLSKVKVNLDLRAYRTRGGSAPAGLPHNETISEPEKNTISTAVETVQYSLLTLIFGKDLRDPGSTHDTRG